MRTLLVSLLCSSSLVAAGTAAAGCGDGNPEPLSYMVATPTIKSDLLSTYLKAHPELTRSQVSGPLQGRTFYGADDMEWAVTSFSIAGHPTAPVIFMGNMGSEWSVIRQTHGGICDSVVPNALITNVWKMRLWSGHCYVER